jgi:hypothetical protein
MPVNSIVHEVYYFNGAQSLYPIFYAFGQVGLHDSGDCGVFVEFMLNEILQTMKRHRSPITGQDGGVSGGVNGGVSGGVSGGVNEVLAYIETHPGCRANEIREALSITLRSAQRYLADLKNSGKIEFRGAPKNGGYWRMNQRQSFKPKTLPSHQKSFYRYAPPSQIEACRYFFPCENQK